MKRQEQTEPDFLDYYLAWMGGCTIAAMYAFIYVLTHGIVT